MNSKPLVLIFFSFFILHFSLFAQDPLPPLVKAGEPLSQIDKTSLYMDNRSPIYAVAISDDGKITPHFRTLKKPKQAKKSKRQTAKRSKL